MREQLEKLAAQRGLTVVDRGQGHFQIVGGTCLVNYYPHSKRKSAYIAGTTGKARHHVTPQQAIEMAFQPAPEGWNKPRVENRPVVAERPAKRTPAEWASLLPHMRFAFKREELG